MRENNSNEEKIRKEKKNSDAIVEVVFEREREARGFVLSFLSREGQDKINIKRKNSSSQQVRVCECVCLCVVCVLRSSRLKD